jgi:hypothetical protein
MFRQINMLFMYGLVLLNAAMAAPKLGLARGTRKMPKLAGMAIDKRNQLPFSNSQINE